MSYSQSTSGLTAAQQSFLRRLAYDRGHRDCTFATRDESAWPGYDRAFRAGARRNPRYKGFVSVRQS